MRTFLSSIAHSIPIITFLVYYSYAQQPGNAYLERRITDLEKRVAILESKLKSSSSEKSSTLRSGKIECYGGNSVRV